MSKSPSQSAGSPCHVPVRPPRIPCLSATRFHSFSGNVLVIYVTAARHSPSSEGKPRAGGTTTSVSMAGSGCGYFGTAVSAGARRFRTVPSVLASAVTNVYGVWIISSFETTVDRKDASTAERTPLDAMFRKLKLSRRRLSPREATRPRRRTGSSKLTRQDDAHLESTEAKVVPPRKFLAS